MGRSAVSTASMASLMAAIWACVRLPARLVGLAL